ncbi:anhydro-N-acetylmuramic acid kinase [Solemya velesiana gill symbiont]|uniref:Anhydro-N-acetylmuramic acid kinase n=1 Tax=Solemya velesiana gill symbiont TaxID=1918948 RepID=A0A1T2KXV3_9GAMM|nr:anhydro-N-acetylmuramic acid kinase [Solemya velesiana gill symbiont]OOZ37634.1 anhydro-N-acetylmuramic acid kinase [Solemya velesiana gill symbiont]
MSDELYIGLMSGTSMDGIDAVLARIDDHGAEFLDHQNTPWPADLQKGLRNLATTGQVDIDQLGSLDSLAAEQFAKAAIQLLEKTGKQAADISAIGSHGQTIRHRPTAATPFTMQIANPSLITERTGITVVADFRRRDMAAGGEGAPLVPAFHAAVFGKMDEERVILNLGGIANITHLPADEANSTSGFDTGPANTLLDYWVRKNLGTNHDEDGQWAAGGSMNGELLNRLLTDAHFQLEPPKSTGPEYFSPDWIKQHLADYPDLAPRDVQATLTALTAVSIEQAISAQAPNCQRVITCGGGVNNGELMRQLAEQMAPIPVESSAIHGIDPAHVESLAFAWLARQTLHRHPGNLPSATGASHPVILGGIYPA